MRTAITALLTLVLTGCLGMPEKVTPVNDFNLERYLGQWYEIARLDHAFERGLEQITATYTEHPEGGVRVVNRGYSVKEKAWRTAEGRAYFVNDKNKGYFKVSFFGPFYGSYVIFELDREAYQYAFVSGPDTSYLWLLSRTPQVPDELVEKFKRMAASLGFATDALIFVNHAGDA